MPIQEQDQTSTLKEKNLFSWRAPVRPFKARGRDFFSTVLAIAGLLALILFFIEGIMPVFVIVAVVFLTFVLFSIPPEEVEYQITNQNILISGRKYPLDSVSRFWVSKRWGNDLLVFETPLRFPGRLELVVSGVDIESLKSTLANYVTMEEAPPTFLDRAASWLSARLPLE